VNVMKNFELGFLPLLLLLGNIEAYKIKRTDCRQNDSLPFVLHCTCGGIGDPFSIILNKGPKPELGVPYYGTRFGHNLVHQIKQKMVDLNITKVTHVYYEECSDHALRIKIDFDEFSLDPIFQKDLTSLEEISFLNVHSVALYLKSSLDWGNVTIRFENILTSHDFGYGKTGSVVAFGGVEYCYKPCILAPTTPAGEEDDKNRCNECDPDSTLSLQFKNMESVLLKDLNLSPLGPGMYGHCSIDAEEVGRVSVEGGDYMGVKANLARPEEGCWGWQERVNCTQVLAVGGVSLEEGSSIAGAICGAVGAVLLLLAVVAVVAGARIKSDVD